MTDPPAGAPDIRSDTGTDRVLVAGEHAAQAPKDGAEDGAAAAAARGRRRLEALGETLPVESTDETGIGWSEPATGSARDDEIRREVPPHHG